MNTQIKKILKKLLPDKIIEFVKEHRDSSQKSYSQCGEDLLVKFALGVLNIRKPSYLDIGTYHPSMYNNTYLFYKNGSNGVCVEPDKDLMERIKNKRPRDVCLNIGVGVTQEQKTADFFVMSAPALNTFSKESAEQTAAKGVPILSIRKIPLISINNIIAENFTNCPNFISIDAEGFDFEILKTFDFNKYRPEVFCVETTTYSRETLGDKIQPVIDFMLSKKYMVFGDTYLNTIFLDKDALANQRL